MPTIANECTSDTVACQVYAATYPRQERVVDGDTLLNQIEHFIEPSRLFLVWQRPIQEGNARSRHIVGEIARENSDAVFRYLDMTEDFQQALQDGFQGYPAFRLNVPEHRNNVLYAFTSRMTSRKRGDFSDYLAAYFLPTYFSGSDFSLLAHTGARLPSDGFEVVADLSTVNRPFDLIIEIAGTRYQPTINFEDIAIGDSVQFIPEPDNIVDPNAIIVMHRTGKLGYIPKPYCAMLQSRFIDGDVTATINKLNGRPERRLIYLIAHF